MLTYLLIAILVMIGGATTVGTLMYAAEKRRRGLPAGDGARALPAGSGDKLLERTIRDLRPGDVLTMDGRDFLVEGVLSYDEDGHRWVAGRIVDGSDVRWLVVGIERVGAALTRLLQQDSETEVSGYPPEAMVVGTVRYTLDKRGTATAKLAGDVGPMGGMKAKRPADHVERCRWWLYDAAGDDTLIVEQWGGEYRVLRGKKVAGDTLDLIPGS
ncbi:MAG: DUF4178 domain-containing protein [Kofleriaceae bacterium]|nr:DUF4178 domain-containing protein [Myxococcales bacterium]MCB9559428.1 DUF4178 domain-containing protein [Kofleriaceae bacterium]